MECFVIDIFYRTYINMPLTRSRENLLNLEEPANCSFTIPVDDSNTVPMNTRGRSKRRAGQNGDSRIVNDNCDDQIRQVVSESMVEFRGEMTQLIRNELRAVVQDLNLGGDTSNRGTSNIRNVGSPSDSSNNNSNGQNLSREPILGEKVSNLIRNWRIKFTGSDDQMTVDDFIYRINVLTSNNLNGDFDLLCKHAHGLFDGKALDWYWRYHRRDNDLDWFALTRALREQYKGDYTDFDIMEDIHRRKQRHNESFDDFYNSIAALTDRLKTPITDANLCCILIRNLRNEIRHELIHLEITTVTHLRREVKRHEKFVKDVRNYDSRKAAKGHLAELSVSETEYEDSNSLMDICAVRGEAKCWNCDKTGHNYYDCLDVRRVFCFGCGAKDTYRPSCPKCGVKSQGNGQKDVRRT